MAVSDEPTSPRESDSLNVAAPAAPRTAGEMLRDQFMGPLNLSARVLARELEVTTESIIEVLNGASGVTEDLAIRLGQRFNNSARFWLNLQNADQIAPNDFPPLIANSVAEPRTDAENGVRHSNLA